MVADLTTFGQFGRLPAVYKSDTPRLASYMLGGVIPAVESVDYTAGLQIPWQVLMNNTIGCCTLSAVGHLAMGWSITMQDPRLQMMTDQEVQTYYEIIGNYKPGDPTTDNGCIMTKVLDYWRDPGIRINTTLTKIVGYTYLNPKNVPLMRYVLRKFGGLYIGIQVPKSAEDDMTYWDVKGNSKILGGHCLTLQGVNDDNDFFGITWGQRARISPNFLSTYCDECYLVWTDRFKDVDNLDHAALQQDFGLVKANPN